MREIVLNQYYLEVISEKNNCTVDLGDDNGHFCTKNLFDNEIILSIGKVPINTISAWLIGI